MGTDDRQHLTEQQIAKLWTAHRELSTVVWGDDKMRDNGYYRWKVCVFTISRKPTEGKLNGLHKMP